MITITLQFTSAASAMAALAKLDGSTVVEAAPAPKLDKPAAKKSAPAPDPVDAPAQDTAPPAEARAPAAAPVPEPAPAPTPAPAPAPQVAYADLQKAVLALYKVDKAKAAAIAQGMGYETFKVMPAERWAEALELVNANLAA